MFCCTHTSVGAWVIDLKHDGLGKYRRLTGFAAERHAATQLRLWEDQWRKRRKLESKADARLLASLKKAQAEEASDEARRAVDAVTSILLNTLRAAPPAPPPRLAFAEAMPAEPAPPAMAAEPQKKQFRSPMPLTLMQLINPAALRRRREGVVLAHKAAHEQWQSAMRWKSQEYERAMQSYRAAYAGWEARRASHAARQAQAAARFAALGETVEGRCDLALMAVDRPDGFPKFWRLAMASGVVSVDYDLPSLEVMPSVKAVRFGRDGFDTVLYGEHEREQLYAEAVLQTALAALHVLFGADEAIGSVIFNGWANVIDHTRPVRACILTLTAPRRRFEAIDLKSADPHACFKALNGAMSARLAAMASQP